ncbi:MAG: GNAT family N-acetyltransferase [Halanaerobiales bacterium]
MLDKSVEFHRVIMHRKKGTPVPEPSLPEGFKFVRFQEGDEKEWAEIEASVGEFERAVDALVYFQENYLPHKGEVERRTIFIESSKEEKVATLTNWWDYTGFRRDPWLHWVAVKPEFQNLGLGKAVIFEGMQRMLKIEGDRDVYLPTQTWSYKAIGIYQKAGFEVTPEKGLGGFDNEYEQAMPILEEVMK